MWGAALAPAGLLLSVVGLFLGVFGWLWLCAGFRLGGWRGVAGTLALQVSGICLVYGLLRGRPMFGVFTAMFPPLAVVEVAAAGRYSIFLRALMWGVAPYAGVVLVLCLAHRPLRRWSLGITLLSALIAAEYVGDQISQTAMCTTAARRGFYRFDRTSFATSLTLAPQPLNFDIHAKAGVGGQTLSWTYSAMDWGVLPPAIAQNVHAGGPFTCPPNS